MTKNTQASNKHESPGDTSNEESSAAPKIKESGIFWGPVIILVGVLALLGSLGVIDVHLDSLWQLWPILIVGIGVSLLPLKDKWGLTITGIVTLVVLAVITVAVTTKDFGVNPNREAQKVSVEQDAKINNSEVTVKAGAAKLLLNTSSTTIASASLKSDYLTLNKKEELNGQSLNTTFTLEGKQPFMVGGRNELSVRVGENIPLSLNIDSGAASIEGNLRNAKLKKFTLDAGASSVDVTFGDKEPDQQIAIEAGASSVTLRIPRDSGIKVYADNGATSYMLDDIDKVSEGVYESKNLNTATKRVSIRTDMGAASFTIERY